ALAVVARAARRKAILQLPGESDAPVMVRAPRPSRVPSPDDRFPQAREPLRESVEGGADADLLDEGEGVPLASDPARGHPAEGRIPGTLEIPAGERTGRRGWRGHSPGGDQSNTSP